MVNPKLRFKRQDGTAYPDWAAVQLADIATRVTRKNKNDETDVPLTIASIEGLVDQRTYFGKTVASKDMSGYFLLKNGEFAYNKSYSVGYDYGAIKRLDKYDQGALSTLYICFALNDPSWSDFMVQYFDSLKWNAEMPKICAEGARNHGLLNVAPADFFKISMALPTDPEERDRIVEGLQSIMERIECQASRVAALETQKKELLRQVFAREIRFKDEKGQDYPEWNYRCFGDIMSCFSGGTPTAGKSEYYGGAIPFIRSAEIHNDKTELFLSEMGYSSSSAKMVEVDDLLYALYGANSGDVAISKIKGAINQAILCIRLHEDNIVYIAQWLEYSRDAILARYLQGGQGNLSADIVKSLNAPLPSLPEQQRIADFFTALDAQIENERALLEDWRQLKKGLLQQMFV